MTERTRPVDAALLADWGPWIAEVLPNLTSTGYGRDRRWLSADELRSAATSPDAMHTAAIERGGRRGLVVVTRSTWEEKVIGRAFAKVPVLLADSHEIAAELARGALRAGLEADVVLMSLKAGNAPTYVHVALSDAGWHVGSEQLVHRAEFSAMAGKLARIPMRGTFRPATAADADVVADIGARAFTQARYVSDPHFPAEWGRKIYREWARQLVTGAADAVVVAEHKGRVVGFASMSLDHARRAPGLLAVDPDYDAFGLGVMLERWCFDWHRERGSTGMTLRTEKNNVAVNAMYRSLGLEIVDSDVTYHASPALEPLRTRLRAEVSART